MPNDVFAHLWLCCAINFDSFVVGKINTAMDIFSVTSSIVVDSFVFSTLYLEKRDPSWYLNITSKYS